MTEEQCAVTSPSSDLAPRPRLDDAAIKHVQQTNIEADDHAHKCDVVVNYQARDPAVTEQQVPDTIANPVAANFTKMTELQSTETDSGYRDCHDHQTQDQNADWSQLLDEIFGTDEPEWKGWAEIENDPAIFSIILREWGLHNVQVDDIFDVAQILVTENDVELLGLIFLSKWLPPSERKGISSLSAEVDTKFQPWFSNQISKFSCGTVALLNIIFNCKIDLATTPVLNELRKACTDKSAKEKGRLIDSNATLRTIHNSFATHLDRQIVDVMLKDDAQADAKRRKQNNGYTSKKRRKKSLFSTRKKKDKSTLEDEENGYHFVAYVEHDGYVWRLDGMEKTPQSLGSVPENSSWREIAAEHVMAQTVEAQEQGLDYSLMSVTWHKEIVLNESDAKQKEEHYIAERDRRRDDWAPFIECMLRIHAERGGLNAMLAC